MAKDPKYDLDISLEDVQFEDIDIDEFFKESKLEIPNISEVIGKYTDNDIAGNGVFDILMHSAEAHIHDEYSKNRITGASYAQLYLGVMNTIIQASIQMVLQADTTALEAEKLRAEIAQIKLQAKRLAVDIYKAKVEVALAKLDVPLKKAQVATEQAKTQDVIMNGEAPEDKRYGDITSNIGGYTGIQIATAVKGIDSQKKNDALALAKETVVQPFSIIEGSEGVGASYFGLQGSNGLEALNNLRRTYGLTEINTHNPYSSNHQKYINKYCPDAVDQETSSE